MEYQVQIRRYGAVTLADGVRPWVGETLVVEEISTWLKLAEAYDANDARQVDLSAHGYTGGWLLVSVSSPLVEVGEQVDLVAMSQEVVKDKRRSGVKKQSRAQYEKAVAAREEKANGALRAAREAKRKGER